MISDDIRALTRIMHRYGFPEFEQLLNRAYLQAAEDLKSFNPEAHHCYAQAALAIIPSGLDPQPLEGKLEQYVLGDDHRIMITNIRVEIKMTYKPNADTRIKLKSLGFYWVSKTGCWTQLYTEKIDSPKFKSELASALDSACRDTEAKSEMTDKQKFYMGDKT